MSEKTYEMFDFIFDSGAFQNIAEALKLNPSTQFGTLWQNAEKIYNNVMVPIALGLMIIWFLVKVMERAANEQITLEQFFMLFVKLIAAKYLIDNGFALFTEMWSLGISLIDKVGGVLTPQNTNAVTFNKEALWKELTNGLEYITVESGKARNNVKLLTAISVMFQLLLPWLATLIMIACTYFIVYSRLIEMLWRICGAPIALSDFMSEGLHGAGWRYLKNFMAICLQGMIILIIYNIYTYIYVDIFTNNSEGFWITVLMQLATSFAAVSLMFKSLSLSKELLGTG